MKYLLMSQRMKKGYKIHTELGFEFEFKSLGAALAHIFEKQ